MVRTTSAIVFYMYTSPFVVGCSSAIPKVTYTAMGIESKEQDLHEPTAGQTWGVYHGNHPCWRWLNADVREYVDTSDFYALTAPRPLIVETGKVDFTFSQFPQPFASDKQVLRRSRIAYGGVS